MRDVLLVVTAIGGLGIMFVLALAASKYGVAMEKERQASGTGDNAEPPGKPAQSGWQREVNTGSGCLVIALILLAGMVIGQLVASALDVSGVRQILISSAAIFALCWLGIGGLMLRLRSRSR